MKPTIGVMPLWDEERDCLWMRPGYLDGVRQAGGVPFLFPLIDDRAELWQLAGLCQGFLFTGGQDVSPRLYGETPLDDSVKSCPLRDEMEGVLLRYALERDLPLLGICRGLQFINVGLGGSLWQDIPGQCPSAVDHRQPAPYHEPCHEVILQPGSPLQQLLGEDRIPVNSIHHQAIRDSAPGLETMAVSTDGLIEAVCLPDRRFLWAVQWHPEYSLHTDDRSRKIFRAFVAACEGR